MHIDGSSTVSVDLLYMLNHQCFRIDHRFSGSYFSNLDRRYVRRASMRSPRSYIYHKFSLRSRLQSSIYQENLVKIRILSVRPENGRNMRVNGIIVHSLFISTDTIARRYRLAYCAGEVYHENGLDRPYRQHSIKEF